jgi:carboxylate-amine ligase
LRIADACPQLQDALCIAGLFRAMLGHALDAPHHDWFDDPLTRILTLENRWRAKRRGLRGLFIEPRSQSTLPFAAWLEQVLACIGGQIAPEDRWVMAHARKLARIGGSAEAQLGLYRRARSGGADHRAAVGEVVDTLMQQTALQDVRQIA